MLQLSFGLIGSQLSHRIRVQCLKIYILLSLSEKFNVIRERSPNRKDGNLQNQLLRRIF